MFARIKNLYRKLMEGTVYVQAPLRAFELDDRILQEKYGITVRRIDYNSESDIALWCSIINNSYEDFSFSPERAVKFLTNHPYIIDNQSFVMFVGGGSCSNSFYRCIPY